jgi:hypothetical protein
MSYWQGILLEFQDSWNFHSWSGKTPPQAEVFPARNSKSSYRADIFPVRKSLISDIPGFPAGDGDHSLTFLTVWKVFKSALHCK